MGSPGGNNNPASDDEKIHSFRKRRLSLTRHNAAPDSCDNSVAASHDASTIASTMAVAPSGTASAVSGVGNGSNHKSRDTPPLPVVLAPAVLAYGGDGGVVTSTTPNNNDDASAAGSVAPEKKAQTFRKRRLSLTAISRQSDDGNDDAESSPPNKVGKLSPQQQQSESTGRPRRYSDASLSSLRSNHSGEGLRMRTIHAGEIISQGPPSPSFDAAGAANGGVTAGIDGASGAATATTPEEPHILYRESRPSSKSLLLLGGEDTSPNSPQPKWKKRIVRKDDEDDRKLPFPRDVVGTYSCHGVEPVYDGDYGHGMLDDDDDDDDDDIWTEDISGAPKASTSPNTAAAAAAAHLARPTTAAKINQDRGGVAFPYGNCAKTALFAAYDGHGQGGELVSQFALHEIQSRLEKHPDFNANLEKAFIDTFLAVDSDLQKEPIIEPLYAGTTACVALLRNNVLTCANAGDSRAVVARRKKSPDGSDAIAYDAIDLTIDQNPDLLAERQRIESMGGFVSPPPEPGLSARVWLDEGFSQIGLAMARSIGDHAVARVGVIATPVVSSHTVADEDEFLIIATDGVWEFISSEAAVEIIGANLSRGATKATQALIEAAAAKWHDEEGDYRDDITALVIRLPELWKDLPPASSKS